MRLVDIPQMSRASYRVDSQWKYLEDFLKLEGTPVEMNPDYQRGYIWTPRQQTEYIEYRLKGGMSGWDIFWNCTTWNTSCNTPIEIVDGKQRVEAVRAFLRDEVPIFGRVLSEFSDHDVGLRMHLARFRMHVNDIQSRRGVIQWYIDMNTGGSIHTEADLRPAYDALKMCEDG